MDQNDPRNVDERNMLHDDALDSSRYPVDTTTNGTAGPPGAVVGAAVGSAAGAGAGDQTDEEAEESTGGDHTPR